MRNYLTFVDVNLPPSHTAKKIKSQDLNLIKSSNHKKNCASDPVRKFYRSKVLQMLFFYRFFSFPTHAMISLLYALFYIDIHVTLYHFKNTRGSLTHT